MVTTLHYCLGRYPRVWLFVHTSVTNYCTIFVNLLSQFDSMQTVVNSQELPSKLFIHTLCRNIGELNFHEIRMTENDWDFCYPQISRFFSLFPFFLSNCLFNFFYIFMWGQLNFFSGLVHKCRWNIYCIIFEETAGVHTTTLKISKQRPKKRGGQGIGESEKKQEKKK